MATLSGEEKKNVIAAFETLPTTTIDEALGNFLKAEELNAGHIDNLMYLGKCYIAKGNYTEAQKYLLPIIDATPVDEMDEAQIAEAQQLLDDIGINHFQDESEENDDQMPEKEETDLEETEYSTDSITSCFEEKSNITS